MERYILNKKVRKKVKIIRNIKIKKKKNKNIVKK